MAISLSKNKAAPVASAPETTAVAVQDTAPVAIRHSANADVQGELSRGDINLPGFQIVQSVGPASENHAPGTILLNREAELSSGDTPIKLTVLKVKLSYVENIEYGGETIPRRFDTLAEVKEVGGYLEWIDDKKPPFSKMLDAWIMVEAPADADESILAHFPFEFEGKNYAQAIWSIRGSAFTRAGKLILTAAEFALKDGLYKGSWTLTTKREKLGKNFVFVPILRHADKNQPTVQEFFLTLKG
jgi:hypothetical protein